MRAADLGRAHAERPAAPGTGLGGAGAWWLAFPAAAVVAFTASVLYLDSPAPDIAGLRVLGAAVRGAVSAVFWTAACLLAFGVGLLRPRLRRGGTPLLCAGATALVAVLFHAQGELYCGLGWLTCGDPAGVFLLTLPSALLLATSLVCVGRAFAGAARYREEEIRADRLTADLARAQLDALALQLRPHFLFNTLQSIATLMHRDVAGAQEMLARLRVLLERSTRAAEAREVPLGEELELLRLYTGIEAVRFGDRLRVEVTAGPAAERALVPHLLLQPLVENAVRHAVARTGAGRIEVRAETAPGAGALTLEVRDHGGGFRAGREGAEGIGLTNTRARLRTLYGARHRFELESRPGEGLTVRIRIPLRHENPGRSVP